jgi:hypothetical protein
MASTGVAGGFAAARQRREREIMVLQAESTPPIGGRPGYSLGEPVFVLCNARSGSTLLRFLLDAHPDLACPPETNLPGLCAQLATVWSLIEGAPLSPNRGDEPPEVPEAAIAGVRETVNRMVGSYLERRGKRRYCDKSLGTARFAELLLRVYPEAKFVCTYRHPMDMISSGMEACPWGLTGYGFEPYIAATPGNVVHALANYWTDHTAAIAEVEERFPERCYRLRYEDLVNEPESTAAALFAFLEVAGVPRITDMCFSAERERFGPADYKIWSTSRIGSGSVGRGWSIPTGMIAPPVLATVNELAEKLGYRPVDSQWGTSEPPADLRATVPGTAVGQQASEQDIAAQRGPPRSQWLGDQLRAGLASAELAGREEEHTDETFVAVVITKNLGQPGEYWLVDLKTASVTLASREAQENSAWDVIGTLEAWEQVVQGSLNWHVALRACQLRYCDNGECTPTAADARIGILARILGITSW